MKMSVIGASAGVGLEVVKRALQRGHAVTTLSRRVDSLPDHASLTKVRGSSTNAPDVKLAVQDAQVILVALGTGNSTKATTLYTDSSRILLAVLRELGATPPLIVLTGFGAGDSWSYNSCLMKVIFNLLLKAVYADKSAMERYVTTHYPSWEMIRPGRLTNGPMTGHYRVLRDLTPGMRVGAISRADVAHFMVAAAEHPAQLGAYPALTY